MPRQVSRVGVGRSRAGVGGGWVADKGALLFPGAPWLTGGPHLEFIVSRRRKEEERRAGRAGSWGRRRRLCPPLSCPGSPTPRHRPCTANSLQNQPLAVPGRKRQGHSGQGRDPGRPNQVSARGKGEVPIWAGHGPRRPWESQLGGPARGQAFVQALHALLQALLHRGNGSSTVRLSPLQAAPHLLGGAPPD